MQPREHGLGGRVHRAGRTPGVLAGALGVALLQRTQCLQPQRRVIAAAAEDVVLELRQCFRAPEPLACSDALQAFDQGRPLRQQLELTGQDAAQRRLAQRIAAFQRTGRCLFGPGLLPTPLRQRLQQWRQDGLGQPLADHAGLRSAAIGAWSVKSVSPESAMSASQQSQCIARRRGCDSA